MKRFKYIRAICPNGKLGTVSKLSLNYEIKLTECYLDLFPEFFLGHWPQVLQPLDICPRSWWSSEQEFDPCTNKRQNWHPMQTSIKIGHVCLCCTVVVHDYGL